MTKPYSNDLRQRAVDAVVSGETTRVVAERFASQFQVSSSGINATVKQAVSSLVRLVDTANLFSIRTAISF